jgi:hypothetical protein
MPPNQEFKYYFTFFNGAWEEYYEEESVLEVCNVSILLVGSAAKSYEAISMNLSCLSNDFIIL